MILDTLAAAPRYESLHPAFAAAFAYLRQPGLAAIPDGRHPIEGDRLFAIVEHTAGRGRDQARPESHRRYIDIQYVVTGTEHMGWLPLSAAHAVDMPYDTTRDLAFYHDPSRIWFDVPTGHFVIFYPEDVHAPCSGTGPIHKVVLKIML